MSLKNDVWIKEQVIRHKMIDPFLDHLVKEGISYGLSSYGYDIRVSPFEFWKLSTVRRETLHPKDMATNERLWVSGLPGDSFEVPSQSFILIRSVEYIRMPDYAAAMVLNKSTYARAGIVLPTVVLEPGWEGYITLQVSNMAPLPMKIMGGEGIAQLVFFEGDIPSVTYADREGKYQGSKGITPPKID